MYKMGHYFLDIQYGSSFNPHQTYCVSPEALPIGPSIRLTVFFSGGNCCCSCTLSYNWLSVLENAYLIESIIIAQIRINRSCLLSEISVRHCSTHDAAWAFSGIYLEQVYALYKNIRIRVLEQYELPFVQEVVTHFI